MPGSNSRLDAQRGSLALIAASIGFGSLAALAAVAYFYGIKFALIIAGAVSVVAHVVAIAAGLRVVILR